MHEEDSRVGLVADGCVQQVQEHGSQAVVQAAGEGPVRAEEVQSRQQEGFGPGETFFKASPFLFTCGTQVLNPLWRPPPKKKCP